MEQKRCRNQETTKGAPVPWFAGGIGIHRNSCRKYLPLPRGNRFRFKSQHTLAMELKAGCNSARNSFTKFITILNVPPLHLNCQECPTRALHGSGLIILHRINVLRILIHREFTYRFFSLDCRNVRRTREVPQGRPICSSRQEERMNSIAP